MNPNANCNCHSYKTSPSVLTVQTTEGLKGLSNVFVYVVSNNTTYYVSNCHEITIISSGPVFADNYDALANPLDLRSQTVYDFDKNVAITYNAKGDCRISTLKEAA